MLRKIHIDQRPSLSQETLIALMTMKFNCLECCYESTFTEKLLSECKKATSQAVNQARMIIDDIIFAMNESILLRN